MLIITSAQQLQHLLTVADSAGLRNEWLAAANRCAIASIGPTASQALRNAGLAPDIEPEHPKMGHLILAVAQSAREIVRRKHS